jgi:hypothetical protein
LYANDTETTMEPQKHTQMRPLIHPDYQQAIREIAARTGKNHGEIVSEAVAHYLRRPEVKAHLWHTRKGSDQVLEAQRRGHFGGVDPSTYSDEGATVDIGSANDTGEAEHLSVDTLAAYFAGTLSSGEEERTELHLADCDECADRARSVHDRDHDLKPALDSWSATSAAQDAGGEGRIMSDEKTTRHEAAIDVEVEREMERRLGEAIDSSGRSVETASDEAAAVRMSADPELIAWWSAREGGSP